MLNPDELTPDELQHLIDQYQFDRTMDAIALQQQLAINQGNAAAIRQDLQQGTTFRTRAIMDFEQRMRQAEQAGFNRAYRIE